MFPRKKTSRPSRLRPEGGGGREGAAPLRPGGASLVHWLQQQVSFVGADDLHALAGLVVPAALALHASRGRWFARLETHGVFPATRDQVVFEQPHRRIHQPAWFAYGATLGLGIQLGR